MRSLGCGLLFICLLVPLLAVGQDAGSVTGTVTDKSGAVVAGADVELQDISTNRTITAKTNSVGQYTFTRVEPSVYRLTVKAPNFRTAVISGLKVSVGKTASANTMLEVGQVTERVEVSAVGAELQTLDASVGNVLSANQLANMPSLTRDATQLILLQPTAMPAVGAATDENLGGQVAGARSDQNTFMIDGGDATSNTEANGAYTTSFLAASIRAAIPTPVESLEEFRVVTNNATAGFGRGTGGEVQMVTRRGTNAYHGAAYFYGQWDNTNANTWDLNNAGSPKPELRDGRFGARLGGPVFKDKTFFFMHYEGRHFLHNDTRSRSAPAQSVRNGLLGFIDTSGAKRFINPATQDCNGNPAAAPNTCDPLGLGLNPTVLAIWNQMPLPNRATGGDGVNFLSYTFAAPTVANEEFGVMRLDHQISQKWHAMASYRYGVTDSVTLNQIRLAADGTATPTSSRPAQPRYVVFGLTGQLTSNLSNDLHFDYLRHWWQWSSNAAKPQVAGLGGAVQLVNESSTTGVVPVNIDTQNARQRNWNGKDWNIIDNMSWMKGKHLMQFGGRMGWQRLFHTRDDKVTFALSSPVYYSLWSSSHPYISGIPLPSNARSNSTFRTTYAAMLGLIEEANVVRVRDGSLALLPQGSVVQADTAEKNWEIHWVDTWRLRPSLTVTYGLGWGVQLPPYEKGGKQTLMVDASNNHVFSADEYLNNKKAAALQGKGYNPVLGFMPIKELGRKYPFDVDYTNLSPRAAVAWNPSISSGPLGWLFGDKKTVVRAGWTRVFDRVTGVDIVMTPALGIGFSDVASCRGPLAAGGCAGSAGSTPTTGFRIGTSGNTITIPDPPPVTAPVIPGIAGSVPGVNSPYATRDYRIDPRRQVGSADVFDLSVQRELPARLMLEVGFVGRIGRDLYEKVDVPSQIPYMFTMGGRTFAQAYDQMQTALVGGQTPGVDPFWEAALGGTSSAYCTGFASCTAAVAANEGSLFQIRDVFDVFADLDTSWVNGSFLPFINQEAGSNTTMSNGVSRYAGMFVSLRKTGAHGLTFDANYTLSKSLDTQGWNQDIIDALIDGYFPKRSYGPSLWDRRHVLNALVNWEMPFGRGKRWAASGPLDKLFGGWSTSYIFTASSGQPLLVLNGDSCLEFGDGTNYIDCSGMVPVKGVSIAGSRHDTGVTIGANGYGSNSANGALPNLFSNPDDVAAAFRLPLFTDLRSYQQNGLRGQRRWNLDFGLSKTTRVTERLSVRFDMQMINAFNHPMLQDPSWAETGGLDLASPADFGVLSQQYNHPRTITWGLRFDF